MTAVYHRSDKQDWRTPPELFAALSEEFEFGIDVAADEQNHLAPCWYDRDSDALTLPWAGYGDVWCNPPYGRDVGRWIAKAAETVQKGGLTVVMLLAARPDTRAWQQHIIGQPNVEVRFLPGRVKFIGESGQGQSAPFPSAVVVFRPADAGYQFGEKDTQ